MYNCSLCVTGLGSIHKYRYAPRYNNSTKSGGSGPTPILVGEPHVTSGVPTLPVSERLIIELLPSYSFMVRVIFCNSDIIANIKSLIFLKIKLPNEFKYIY